MEVNQNSTKFLSTYNELDDYMRRILKRYDAYNIHASMIDDMREISPLFRNEQNYNDLMQFARLRNAIVHNHRLKSADPIAEPHEEIVEQYSDFVAKLLRPPKALDCAISTDRIYSTSLFRNAIEEMNVMAKKSYTHLPVLEDGNMIGVFSENTVFSYLVQNKDVIIDREMKIEDFIDFIDIEQHSTEYFKFVSRDTLYIEVEEIFRKGLNKNKRIAVVYITEHGNIEEKLLGMITPWDLIRYDENDKSKKSVREAHPKI